MVNRVKRLKCIEFMTRKIEGECILRDQKPERSVLKDGLDDGCSLGGFNAQQVCACR